MDCSYYHYCNDCNYQHHFAKLCDCHSQQHLWKADKPFKLCVPEVHHFLKTADRVWLTVLLYGLNLQWRKFAFHSLLSLLNAQNRKTQQYSAFHTVYSLLASWNCIMDSTRTHFLSNRFHYNHTLKSKNDHYSSWQNSFFAKTIVLN